MNDGLFSVYIHLPFCKSRCVYCDFFSTTTKAIPFVAYRRALMLEWQQRRAAFRHLHRPLTIYIGGGTPSLWPKDELLALLDAFALRGDEEVTVEVNPKDADEQWFRDLVQCGVNRFSIGVQALDDERLSFLGRRHSAEDAGRCVSAALSSGARSVSADLIFGTSSHTTKKWRQELESIIDLGVHHVSAYELTLAKGTPLAKRHARGEPVTASEKAMLALYRTGRAMFRKAGLVQYEVSNFARKGHRSIHNSQYWRGGEYLGLGAGAHGFVKSVGRLLRYGNTEDVDEYLRAAESAGQTEDGLGKGAFTEQISILDHARELMMLGLRTSDGAAFEKIISVLPSAVQDTWKLIAKSLQNEKLVRLALGRMIPTARGMLCADGIAERFF
jgi:putative oxygen-independent coproporphyrinogen III oxidase